MIKKIDPFYLIIILISGLLYLPFLGSVHLFDWDEINFAECAREMIRSGNYLQLQIDFHPFFEKPPLFIWMQVLSMKSFGVNEFAARLPDALCGITTLCTLYFLGKREFNSQLAKRWVLAYAGSLLPQFYFKSGIIDPWFNLCIFLSLYQYFIFYKNKMKHIAGWRALFLSGLFLGLAVLTKGPIAAILFFILWLISLAIFRHSKKIFSREWFVFAVTLCAISGSWFFVIWNNTGSEFIHQFLNYQWRLLTTGEAGHGQPWWYHLPVILFGCFPASAFLFLKSKNISESDSQKIWKQMMWVLFFIVLILFSIVKTKIVHYTSLCYFPLSFLAAYFLSHSENYLSQVKLMKVVALMTGLILSVALLLIPFIASHPQSISSMIKNEYVLGCLNAGVEWKWFTFLPAIVLLSGISIAFIFFHSLKKMFLTLFVSSILCVQLIQILIIPLVEKQTQGAAIEFYEQVKKNNETVDAYRFKSYAYLFYTDKPQANKTSEWEKYLVMRADLNYETEIWAQYGRIGVKNGFIFLQKKEK